MNKLFLVIFAVALAMPLTALSQIGTPKSDPTTNVWQGQGVGTPRTYAHRGVSGQPGENAVGTPYEVKTTETIKVTVENTQAIPGPKGADGANGTNGLDGQPGADGKKGDPGLNGTNGTDGTAGPKGADGHNGRNGKNGKNGRNGRNAVVKHHYVFDNGRWIMYQERENAQDARIDTLSGRINTVSNTAKADDQKLRQEIAETYVSKSEYEKKNKADLNMVGLIIFAIIAIIIFAFAALRARRN